ncbi:MAG: histidine kinase [Dehalococcoidia bacterium]
MITKAKAVTSEWQSSDQELAQALRALGSPSRLHILRLLDSNELSAAEMAGALEISTAEAKRLLKDLIAARLVEAHPTDAGERFRLNRTTAAFLNASVVSLLGRAGIPALTADTPLDSADSLPLSIPSPPNRCLDCQNIGFVRGVLEELDHTLVEAREYQSRLQHLSSQVLAAHEGERKRIARDLHDDTAQALTSILVRLRLLERSVNGDARQDIAELRDLTGSTLDSVRRIAADLRPSALDDLGLVAAIHSYIEKFSQHWPVRVEFSSTGPPHRLPAELELVLYRVIQEALSNVAKHSGASSARVTLSRKKNLVTATIVDEGRGFDVEEMIGPGTRHLGLFGMKERLALVGGWLDIEASIGGGTKVVARVPLSSGKPGRD